MYHYENEDENKNQEFDCYVLIIFEINAEYWFAVSPTSLSQCCASARSRSISVVLESFTDHVPASFTVQHLTVSFTNLFTHHESFLFLCLFGLVSCVWFKDLTLKKSILPQEKIQIWKFPVAYSWYSVGGTCAGQLSKYQQTRFKTPTKWQYISNRESLYHSK